MITLQAETPVLLLVSFGEERVRLSNSDPNPPGQGLSQGRGSQSHRSVVCDSNDLQKKPGSINPLWLPAQDLR